MDSVPLVLANVKSFAIPICLCILLAVFLIVQIKNINQRSNAITSPGGDHDESYRENVPMLPYYLPWLGHLPTFIFNPERLFVQARDTLASGAFSLHLAGSTHYFVHSPSLVQVLLAQKPSVLFFDVSLIHRIFGVPEKYGHLHDPHDSAHLLREPYLGNITKKALRGVEEGLPNLVSFVESPVDLSDWERLSGAVLTASIDGRTAVEVNLLTHVINFVGYQTISSLMGTDFHQKFPNILQDLWQFNEAFLLLVIPLPSWIPIPFLTPRIRRGKAARARLNQAFAEYHRAMDAYREEKEPGAGWNNLDDVSSFMVERHRLFYEKSSTPHSRAPGDMGMLWAFSANSNFILFWLIIRICSIPGLADRIRKETAPYVKVVYPEPVLNISPPPTIKIDHTGLVQSCPLTRSCFIESLRLDSASFSVKTVMQDLKITENIEDATKRGSSSISTFKLKKGSWTQLASEIHHTDPNYYVRPLEFIPDRHVTVRPDGSKVAEWGTVRPWGGGSTMCKGRLFAEREVLALLSGILALWDFEPAAKAGWKLPSKKRATSVAIPKSDVRVRIMKRAS